MFDRFSRKAFTLSFSVILLVLGLILYNGELSFALVHFVNSAFTMHLNVSFWAVGFGYVSTLLMYAGLVGFAYLFFLSGKINQQQFGIAAISLFVVHYFFYLVKNSFNYPIYDDHGAILEFLNQYTNAHSFQEKISLLFAPFWESRMTVPRVFILFLWNVFHEINFRYLVWFDAVLLLSFHFFLMKKILQHSSNRLFYILAFSFLALQFQAYNSIFCSISGLCYNGVMLFALLAFSFLERKNLNGNVFALACTVAAELTFGNGLWVFPLAILYLWKQKRMHEVAVWSAVMMVILVAGVIGKSTFNVYNGVSFQFVNFLLFIPGVLGSAFQFLYTMHLPVLTGCFVLIVFMMAVFKKWHASSFVVFMMLAFFVISAVSAAPFRSGIIPGGQYALQVRYGIFSIYASITALAVLIENTSYKEGKKYRRILAFAFAYNLCTGIFFYPEVNVRTQNLRIITQDVKNRKFTSAYSIYKDKEFETLMQESISKGIYKPD